MSDVSRPNFTPRDGASEHVPSASPACSEWRILCDTRIYPGTSRGRT